MGRASIACIRYMLCAFTLTFLIFGVLLLYSGFSTFISINHYSLFIHNRPDLVVISILILGASIIVVSFLGCCGAITGNDCMLRTFSIILTLILICELSGVVLVLLFKNTIHRSIETGIQEAIRKFNSSDNNAVTKMIDEIQTRFECCGANGPSDWSNNTEYDNGKLPDSCCPLSPIKVECSINNISHYSHGCVDIISEELKNSLSFLRWVVICFVIVKLCILIFACKLINTRDVYEYV